MPSAATWMDVKMIILSEISQIKKTISNEITYMRNLKIDINELFTKQTDFENKHDYSKGEVRGEG